MLRIHYSNRFEVLAALLCNSVGGVHGSAFTADTVIVPGAAVRRRLTLDIASTHGICANVQFSNLSNWLWSWMARVLPEVPDRSPFEPSMLSWHIYAEFNQGDWTTAHPRLVHYLGDADHVMRFDIAQHMARLFDQYSTYRADWLEAWAENRTIELTQISGEASADQSWQAELWRRLLERIDSPMGGPDSAIRQALAVLELPGCEALTDMFLAGNSATPVHVFCLPTIPPAHLSLLQAVARHVDINLYVLNPCARQWYTCVDENRSGTQQVSVASAYEKIAHPLLASWGRQTQSQLQLLSESIPAQVFKQDSYQGPTQTTLLASLQRSILELQDLHSEGVVLAPDDRSIEVHLCHSLTREIEALQDWLLSLFAENTGGDGAAALRPEDVLVVTPDLESAAPVVNAIFGTAPAARAIPYTITGQAASQANPVARVLIELLALLDSRSTASAVFGLLQQPMVARRFGLDDDQLSQIQAWLLDSGARWALDAGHRAELGVPGYESHTLADALERLYLGYALPSSHTSPFNARLPSGDAEGSTAEALGALGAYVKTLADLRTQFASPMEGTAWSTALGTALERCMQAEGAEHDDLADVLDVLSDLDEELGQVALQSPLPLQVVRIALQRQLDDPARGGVPSGAVTVSSMSSLRTLPYRVICIFGLNDGKFPSAVRPDELDLMGCQFRLGDRQRRFDERNLLLDLLLAARDRLFLSYTGKDAKDNSVLPPSVLLSQLLDYLREVIAGASEDNEAQSVEEDRLIVRHALQPFSSRAFDPKQDPRQHSHVVEYAEALLRRDQMRSASRRVNQSLAGTELAIGNDVDAANEQSLADAIQPFFAGALPTAGDEWQEVPLDQLIWFYRNPCRFLIERRLSIALPRTEPELLDDEPFVLKGLDAWSLANRLLPALLEGVDENHVRKLAFAGTELPPGPYGELYLDEELADLQVFAEQQQKATREPLVTPYACAVEISIDSASFLLSATFAELRPCGLIRARYAKLSAMDYLGAWLQHLVLCVNPPPGVAPVTRVIGRDGQFAFSTCEQPEQELQNLLSLYWQGLHQPLAFFPKSAKTYVFTDKPEMKLSKARASWYKGYTGFGEEEDAAYKLALRGRPDPLEGEASEFTRIADAVFGPLLRHHQVDNPKTKR